MFRWNTNRLMHVCVLAFSFLYLLRWRESTWSVLYILPKYVSLCLFKVPALNISFNQNTREPFFLPKAAHMRQIPGTLLFVYFRAAGLKRKKKSGKAKWSALFPAERRVSGETRVHLHAGLQRNRRFVQRPNTHNIRTSANLLLGKREKGKDKNQQINKTK